MRCKIWNFFGCDTQMPKENALWLFVEINFMQHSFHKLRRELRTEGSFLSKSAKRKTTRRVSRLMKQNMDCTHVEPIHKSNLLPFNFWPGDRRYRQWMNVSRSLPRLTDDSAQQHSPREKRLLQGTIMGFIFIFFFFYGLREPSKAA